MTEEHKQKIRDAHARRAAERREAAIEQADNLSAPVITSGDIDALRTEKGDRRFAVIGEDFRTQLETLVGDPTEAYQKIAELVASGTKIGWPGDHTDHLTPHQSFCVWLKSKPGINASDPRLPSDYARQCVEIEDRLRTAFNAGFVAGKGGVA
jgi:hypothetical protein